MVLAALWTPQQIPRPDPVPQLRDSGRDLGRHARTRVASARGTLSLCNSSTFPLFCQYNAETTPAVREDRGTRNPSSGELARTVRDAGLPLAVPGDVHLAVRHGAELQRSE